MKKRVLSLLVDNTSGVLSRVAGLFSRRGYNIDSLTVGETADPRYSRMTVVARSDRQAACKADRRCRYKGTGRGEQRKQRACTCKGTCGRSRPAVHYRNCKCIPRQHHRCRKGFSDHRADRPAVKAGRVRGTSARL